MFWRSVPFRAGVRFRVLQEPFGLRIRQAELPAGRHTPIVAMTAHAMQGDREHCLRSGFDGYISKPVDPQVLARTIEQSRPQPPA